MPVRPAPRTTPTAPATALSAVPFTLPATPGAAPTGSAPVPRSGLRRRDLLAAPLGAALTPAAGLGTLALAGGAPSAVRAQAAALPVFPPGNAADTFHGVRVADPYRGLENVKDPAVEAWMRAHAEHAARSLAALPGRDAIRADLQRLDAEAPSRVFEVLRTPGGWFYEERRAQDNQFRLVHRASLTAEPRVLADPEERRRATGQPHAITHYRPSPSGTRVAYGIAAGGSEAATLYVSDVATGQELIAPIDRADYAVAAWIDEHRFLFTRLQAMKPGMPATAKYQDAACWLVDLRTGRHRKLLDRTLGGIRMTRDESPFVEISPNGRWALATIIDGVRNELRLYRAPAAAFLAGQARWQRVAEPEDGVTRAAIQGDTLYMLSHKDAPRFRVLSLDLADAKAKAVVRVPETPHVLTGLVAARDALYLEVRQGNGKQLYRLGYESGATPQRIALPFEGGFSLNGMEGGADAGDPRLDGVLVTLMGWTHGRQILLVGADGSVKDTGLQPLGPQDQPTDLEALDVMVPSHDGVKVPMTVIAKKGAPRDGRNPLILQGYASYGMTWEPSWAPTRRAWLDRGGVIAVANPRGSGVFGRAWHLAGKEANKPNTWRDFIACAEWLVANGWTSPKHLGIQGGSAGGILVGRAMTERPDLFAVVNAGVGAMDMVSFERTANGPGNVPEFGSTKTEAGFKALLAMSAYHHVKDGTRYPALLLTHGVNDPRVEVWNSTKFGARVMAAQAGLADAAPVMLRLDWQAGHGMGNTKAQQLDQTADTWAFFFDRMGGMRPR